MTNTEHIWAERLRAWRASGQSAAAFARDKDYSSAALRYWERRLKGPDMMVEPVKRSESLIMARVLRPGDSLEQASSPINIWVRNVRVEVRAGVDLQLLGKVVATLRGTS